MKKVFFIVLACLAMVTLSSMSALAGPKIYWHFTFKAFVDLPDTSAYEWAWATMVEIDRATVFPDQARAVRARGGRFEGTFFAQVRAAAWRSSHRYFRDTKCHDRPAQKEVFWSESESESVYCHGMLYPSQPFRGTPGEAPPRLDKFRFGFTNRKVLHENGRYENLNRDRAFVGAVNVDGEPREETRGGFHLQVVNYRDDLEHHRRCEKAWVEQHKTAFTHFQHDSLEDFIPGIGPGEEIIGQIPYGYRDRNNIVWSVIRSHSREHPFWKQQTM